MSSGTLDLDQIGTNTSNLIYIFPAKFTIQAQATLAIGSAVSVVIGGGETINDDGTMTVGTDSTVALTAQNISTTAIMVNGVLDANYATFDVTGSGFNQVVADIEVNSGGIPNVAASRFSVNSLLNSGSDDTLHFDTFTGTISINSGATINVSGNDFSGVGSNGVIAAGTSMATIILEENYWGSTSDTTIATLIDDHRVTCSLPLIQFDPVWASNSGTIATPETVYFSPDDKTFNFSATVSTTDRHPRGTTQHHVLLL